MESFLLPLGNHCAVAAFHWVLVVFSDHHALVLVLTARSISIEALNILANSNSLLLSFELHHFFSKELNDIDVIGLQLLHIIILEALMLSELASSKFFDAHLALDHNLRAESLNMLSQLGSCHVLELAEIADVAAILGALVILSVLLELSY